MIDAAGDILYRRACPASPAASTPRDGQPRSPLARHRLRLDPLGPVHRRRRRPDDAVSLYAYRTAASSGSARSPPGRCRRRSSSGDLNGDGGDDLVVRDAGDGTLTLIPDQRRDRLP